MNIPVKNVYEVFKTTNLWKHFISVSDSEKQSTVDKLIQYSAPILDRIIETFPTYTLHNGQHQLNILNRMSDLLGERIKDLSDLESAFLILSAFYHDIGMVFSKEDKENLRDELDFKEFLNKYPRAHLAVLEAETLPLETAEWYCRWAHARRVWVYLDKVGSTLKWEGVNIKKQLGDVCLSHNEDAEVLKNEVFEINFWGSADLRFCSIILRLADILDFDNSRSPESVFEYLKLDNPERESDEVSHNEWSKHLASKGFFFNNWNQQQPYELEFRAAPTHPAVENDIKQFLSVIELELQKCATIIRFCSEKWNGFVIPDQISRKNILSQGYKSGSYKFTLDQQQVLDLLMGENLYDDPYVFIRELLQNSIDTSRDREFHEHKNGNSKFVAKPIEVDSWVDSDGFRWVRIDDYGMGMTESIINKYFLKVGNSYYNSDEFKLRKLSYKTTDGIDFTPISRFGIGILSCFIVGEEIEINTRSIECDNKITFPIRLTLKGLHNFYILQTNSDHPLSMPVKTGDENGYRNEIGTSVAVKLKIDKDPINFNLKEILEKILINPPIKVFQKGIGFSGDYINATRTPWCDDFEVELPQREKEQLESFVGSPINPAVKLDVRLINVTRSSSDENLKGQIIIVYINDEIRSELRQKGIDMKVENRASFGRYTERIGLTVTLPNKDKNPRIDIDIAFVIQSIPFFNTELAKINSRNNLILSHNGVTVYNESFFDEPSVQLHFANSFAFGILELKDEFRPGLSVARNRITEISWQFWSELNYCIFKEINFGEKTALTFRSPFIQLSGIEIKSLLYKDLLLDKFITDINRWGNQKIIFTNKGIQSIQDILVSESMEILFNDAHFFVTTLKKALLQKHCTIKLKLFKRGNVKAFGVLKKIYASRRASIDTVNMDYFPPLTFIEYENFGGLLINSQNNDDFGKYFNIAHPFSQWLIKSQQILFTKYALHYWNLLRFESINIINLTLTKLRLILPQEFRPSEFLILSNDDFEVDFSKLEKFTYSAPF